MIGMQDEFAADIKRELGDNRSMDSRIAVAKAVTSESGDLEQNVYDTAQETYLVEEAKWEEGNETHKLTIVREDGEEAYLLQEVNTIDTYSFDLTVSEEAIYAESVDKKSDFEDLINSISDREQITSKKDLEEYVPSGEVGR